MSTDQDHQTDRLANIGEAMLALIDQLVRRGDPDSLDHVDSIVSSLLVAGVWSTEYDLLSIGEYAEFAGRDLAAGVSAEVVMASGYRRRALEKS